MAKHLTSRPFERLESEYPPELETWRNDANEVLLIGNMLERTSSSYRRHIGESLKRGARVRALVTDPQYYQSLGLHHNAETAATSLRKLSDAAAHVAASGTLELRVFRHVPPSNYNVLQGGTVGPLVVWQYHEFAPAGESAPILVLRPADGEWYERFRNDAEKIWAAGEPWTG